MLDLGVALMWTFVRYLIRGTLSGYTAGYTLCKRSPMNKSARNERRYVQLIQQSTST